LFRCGVFYPELEVPLGITFEKPPEAAFLLDFSNALCYNTVSQ